MEIVVIDSSGMEKVRPFLTSATDRLLSSADARCSWTNLRRAARLVQDYCTRTATNEDSSSLTVVCAVDNHDFILKYVSIVTRSALVRRPRFVLISSLLTWSGALGEAKAVDATASFLQRTPVRGCIEEYNMENLLWSTCASSNSGLSIVSFGLLYGKHGFDLEGVLGAVFKGENSVSLNISGDGSNRIPYIHADALVDMLSVVLSSSSDAVEYVPCCEGNTLPIKDLVSKVATKLGGKPVSITGLSSEEYLQFMLDSDTACPYNKWEWSVNVSFSNANCKSEIFTTLSADYNEFLKFNNMLPCGIMVAGGPQMGKSSVAKNIAASLSIELVDAATCLRSVLVNLPGTLDALTTGQQDILNSFSPDEGFNYNSVIGDIATQAETKINSAKKKGAEDVKFANMDKNTLDYSLAGINDMPALSVRGCVFTYLLLNESIRKKGVVLDLWGLKAFSDLQSMKTLRSIANFEIIFDVAGPTSVVVQRLIKSLNITGPIEKAPKDAQAKIKDCEATMAAYAGQLVDGNHPLLTSASETLDTPLVQINADQSIEACVTDCIAKFIEVHGKIGWYESPTTGETGENPPSSSSPPFFSSSSSESPPTTTAAVAVAVGTAYTAPLSKFQAMNTELSAALSPDELESLRGNCDDLAGYLNGTVMPDISKCMIEIIRQRPDDPIQYLADFLLRQGDLRQKLAEQEAKEGFYRIFAEASGRKKPL